jgi:hypothetical protein
VAGNHRTRRLTEDPLAAQRTLDPALPTSLEAAVSVRPSEVLEPPPAQQAGAQLEARQARWFRTREAVRATRETTADLAAGPAENPVPDPKG